MFLCNHFLLFLSNKTGSRLDNANLRDYDMRLWEDDMPIYEYKCNDCGFEEEVLQRISDPVLTVCPKCGGHYSKKISSPAFRFKGSGFYETDYKKSSHAGTSASEKPAEKPEKSEVKTEKSSPKTGSPKETSLVS